jgi:hypothetical protein
MAARVAWSESRRAPVGKVRLHVRTHRIDATPAFQARRFFATLARAATGSTMENDDASRRLGFYRGAWRQPAAAAAFG